MTDNREARADIIARLEASLLGRTHAVSAPAFRATRRKVTDSPPPNGLAEGYGTRKNTNANQRNGGGSCHYKPRAKDFAGALPATTRPNAPTVKPANGIRVSGPATVISKGKRVPAKAWEEARATGQNNAMRAWVATRTNLQRDAGDMPGRESPLPPDDRVTYPRRRSTRSNNPHTPIY